jgi:hypothetical protein
LGVLHAAAQRGADGSDSEPTAAASAAAPALAVSDSSLSIGGLSQEHCLECLRACEYSPRAARDALACKEPAHVTWNKVTPRAQFAPRGREERACAQPSRPALTRAPVPPPSAASRGCARAAA